MTTTGLSKSSTKGAQGRSGALLLSVAILGMGVVGLFYIPDHPWVWGELQLTPLRAWFLVTLGVVASMSSWYRWGYPEHGATVRIWYPIFLASMATVILSDTLWVFMTAWEIMTISSFFLVTTHRDNPLVVRSGYVYLVMSQLSAMLILSGLLSLGTDLHSLNFTVWAVQGHTLSSASKAWAFILLGTGFAIKSGMVPFHVWLPRAHPVAPAPVSSIMSGAMIKLGIFGIIQFLLIDLGPTSPDWAWAIMVVGAVSSLLGVLYALMETDLKRLLAYSSIENIGMILLGVGVASLGLDTHHPAWVVLGLVGSLFHTLNHAIFKGQLFLAAGAIEQHTGSLNADHLGGLLRTMPGIGVGFLIGSMAMSGLPPFNGFVSEWLTLRGLLAVSSQAHGLAAVGGLGLAAVLGLTGALVGVGFVRAFGVIFLGQPRRSLVYQPLSKSLSGPIVGLGGLALVLGVVPGPLLSVLREVAPGPVGRSTGHLTMPLHMPVVAAVLLGSTALFLLMTRPWAIRTVPRWSSGRVPDASMQVSAASFTKAIRTTFALIYRPHRELAPRGPFAPDFPTGFTYEGGTRPIWERYIYRPLYWGVWQASHVSTRLQAGPVRLYLAYLLGTVGILLALLH